MKNVFLIALFNISIVFISSAQFDDRFYFPTREWDTIKGLNYEEMYFDIESERLNGILLKPEVLANTTILFFHGAGGNISKYMFITKPLVDAGYQVFMLDPRGYGKSTGKPTHLNIASDVQIVFNSIIKHEAVKDTRIIVYGASMGTQIAVKIAKDNKLIVKGLILDGTISSFTDMALINAPLEQIPMITQYLISPYSAKEDIKNLQNMPKLFIHSKEDRSVPFSQAKTVYDNASEPKELWVYSGKHLRAVIENQTSFLEKISTIINNK